MVSIPIFTDLCPGNEQNLIQLTSNRSRLAKDGNSRAKSYGPHFPKERQSQHEERTKDDRPANIQAENRHHQKRRLSTPFFFGVTPKKLPRMLAILLYELG